MDREHRRFERQLNKLGRSLPGMDGPIKGLTAPGRGWLRVPVAVIFILGGCFGFLPVLGFWMIPVGLVLLAIDIPGIRPTVARFLIRLQFTWRYWRARMPWPIRR